MLCAIRFLMQQMVEVAMAQCRRDILWNRMLLGDMAEEGTRRKHRSGWTEPEEPKDPVSARICVICLFIKLEK